MADTLMMWLNCGLAALAALAAFSSFQKMQWGKTRKCMIGGMALILLGSAGTVLGTWFEEWMRYADTALYAGVFVVLIASQRTHVGLLERFSEPLARLVCCVGAAAFLFGLLTGCSPAPVAEAQPEERAWQGVCLEEKLGTADNGMAVVRHYCISEARLP